MSDYPLQPDCPCKGPGHRRPPLPATLAMCDHPYKGPSRSRPPLQVAWLWVAAPTGNLPVGDYPLLATYTTNCSKNA
ncbi:hypothetical protein B296_00059039 [Ensete ventricosum]|uniref:Uncharacterized protein n=1 Tax=Ensete ventricosum TaxID=4639 RepID=A0A426XJ79_ENSVE|nr:hypothetical protein B296_00059039 [Ensete ventricosum]